jgi:indolepyruvate ferredoxin oxidoreductase beta subunit
VANCQGLIKGYSDTHARGWNNFARIMQTLDDAPAPLQAAQLRGLREAALADDSGKALDQALSSLRSGSAGGRHMLA